MAYPTAPVDKVSVSLCNAGSLPSDDSQALASLDKGQLETLRAAQNAFYTALLALNKKADIGEVLPVANNGREDIQHACETGQHTLSLMYQEFRISDAVAEVDIDALIARAQAAAHAEMHDTVERLREGMPVHGAATWGGEVRPRDPLARRSQRSSFLVTRS